VAVILRHACLMDDTQEDRAQAQLRAGVYGRLSETYDAAESVPTQLDRGAGHARRRGWTVVATFKDDGYSAFKEVSRDGFGELIAAIETGQVDVVIVRDIDQLTRNLTDWNAFEKACVRHGVRLSAYTGETWTCPRPRTRTTAGWRRCGRGGKARSRARGLGRPRTGRRARGGGPAGGSGGSGTRGFTPTRTSRTTRSGTFCGKRSTRSRPRRSGTRPCGCWSTGSRSPRSRGTGPRAGSGRSPRSSGGRPRSWAR